MRNTIKDTNLKISPDFQYLQDSLGSPIYMPNLPISLRCVVYSFQPFYSFLASRLSRFNLQLLCCQPKPSSPPPIEKLQTSAAQARQDENNSKQESHKLPFLPSAVAVFHEQIIFKLLPKWSFSNALIWYL